jgi:hypothetical protein
MNYLGYIIVTIILLSILIAYEVRWRDQIKLRWLQGTVAVILATIIAPAIFALLSEWISHADKEQEAKFRKSILTFIEQGQTNSQALQDLIELKYREIFKSSEDEAKEWSRNFVASLPDRKNELQKIEDKSKDLSERLREKWQPIFDFTLLSLDARIAELERSTKTNMEFQEIIPIIVDKYPRKSAQVRKVIFPGGAQMIVSEDQGILDRGILTRPPQLIFREVRNGNNDIVFWLRFHPEYISINIDSRHYPKIQESKIEGDFMSESNRKKILAVINYTIEWLFY